MKKAIDIDRFSGIYSGGIKSGSLFDSDNVTVLAGGGVKALLKSKGIDVGGSASLAGVYSYYTYTDSDYEIKTTAEWVYENICPKSVLAYDKGFTAASRILVADVGMPGKTENGYRNIIAAYCDGDRLLVIYDAVYNVIDQRRSDEFSAEGNGYIVTFDSGEIDAGAGTTVCTLTQLWLDVIEGGEISSFLLDAELEVRETLGSKYDFGRMVAKKNKVFHYTSTEYAPDIDASYTIYPDKVYTDVYPRLATDYPVAVPYSARDRHVVRYTNSEDDSSVYGSSGEKLIFMPDMRLLSEKDGVWKLEAKSETIPQMEKALCHFERLFGYCGDTLYVSAKGNCTDYTLADGNVPQTGAFSLTTADAGGFTDIVSFDGKVIAFTEKSMMIIEGDALPFSITYERAYGCISHRALTVCGGYMYFASYGGVYRYNGSSVECISHTLPYGFEYEAAMLTNYCGLVLAYFSEDDALYVFNPQSKQWTKQKETNTGVFFPDGGGKYVFYRNNGNKLYEFFSEKGDFSFAVSLGAGERKRICSVAVCAEAGFDGSLTLADAGGNALMRIDDAYEERVTRRCILHNKYIDAENIYFYGSGEVTLLSLRVEYMPVGNRLVRLK
ncbi:MAG: hypothetical protein IKU61_00890 [Clostridia bacterium]|nr:hypothetical protein [Clostridia bacterium]